MYIELRNFALSIVASFGVVTAAVADSSPVVMTVVGEISKSNRGPVDPLLDRFLVAKGIEFETAYALDLAALGNLEQASATARAYNWPSARTFDGPRLDAVLDLVGADPDATLVFVALDGYSAELTVDDRAGMTWILATHEGGTPLAIGGAGPLWLVPDRGPSLAAKGSGAKWAWSVYFLSVQ